MDRHTLMQKKNLWIAAGAGVVICAGGAGYFWASHRSAPAAAVASVSAKGDTTSKADEAVAVAKHAPVEVEADIPRPGLISRVLMEFAHSIQNVEDKWYGIENAEVDNERLRTENIHLRLALESARFDCRASDAQAATEEFKFKLSKETKSQVGRTLETINYRVPAHLLPPQLYTLGVSYFSSREDEKAAVIFTFLTGMEDNDAYKSPKNYLMTGVAWYRLDNFKLADQFFEKVLASAESDDTISYHAQARLWRGLVAARTGRAQVAQDWLRDLVDHHPHSMEAGWVNAKEAGRGTASAE